jgi:hypothetical protein
LKLENLKEDGYARQLDDKITERGIELDGENVEEQWSALKERLTTISEEVLGTKIIKGTKKKTTPWWNDVEDFVKQKMTLLRRWMKTRNFEDKLAYEEAYRMMQTAKRNAKGRVWGRIGSDLLQYLAGTRKLLYSMAKNYRRGDSDNTSAMMDREGENLLVEEDKIAERWGE